MKRLPVRWVCMGFACVFGVFQPLYKKELYWQFPIYRSERKQNIMSAFWGFSLLNLMVSVRYGTLML